MSGIDQIKKKAKLSIDEMYDNQPVGKLENQENIHPDLQKVGQTTIQTNNKPSEQLNDHITKQQSEQPVVHKPVLETHQNKMEIEKEMFVPRMKPQMIKEPTFKMTFNLPPEIYKAFNDLYAYRMLNGYKTEKSELICEAIKLLINAEKG